MYTDQENIFHYMTVMNENYLICQCLRTPGRAFFRECTVASGAQGSQSRAARPAFWQRDHPARIHGSVENAGAGLWRSPDLGA